MQENSLDGKAYVEPFAGGAGIAWALLFDGTASAVHLNDYDPAIYAFWHSVCDETENLSRLIWDTPVSIRTWRKQRQIINDPSEYSLLELGFATFFLNRTNRSGVVRGGVIGGKKQAGVWKLGCRYNKAELLQRIERIAGFRERIRLYHTEAKVFVRIMLPDIASRALVFIDPPYFNCGQSLYMDVYTKNDHRELAKHITQGISQPWFVSYDDVPAVIRMYGGMKRARYRLSYSVADRYIGSEVLFFSQGLKIPLDAIPRYPVIVG